MTSRELNIHAREVALSIETASVEINVDVTSSENV